MRRRPVTATGLLVAAAGLLAGCGDASSSSPRPEDGGAADASPAAEAVPLAVTSADGTWRVDWRTEPSPIVLDEPFAVIITVVPASDASAAADSAALEDLALSIDARMPHHRHGMLVRPTVRRLGPGRFRAEGLLLHMPGYWELHFDVIEAGVVERAQASFEIDG